jgi:O-acetyl-ADP-ribose deacetylase (regulator of RNase III)
VFERSPDPAKELGSCYVSSLRVADELGALSVAFPAISTGVYGYPMRDAALVAIAAVRGARTRVERARFVLFGDEARRIFADAYAELVGAGRDD